MASAESGKPKAPSSADLDGLNYPFEYVFPRWRDNRDFGVYPDGKGRDDQPQDLLDDFDVLSKRYSYHLYKASKQN